MTDDDSGAPERALPKLTIGQRLLTALPNLQREPAPAPRRAAAEADPADADDSASSTDVTHVTDDETEDATSEAGANGAATRSGRIRDAFLKPAPPKRPRPDDPLAAMSREEIAHRIKKLDDKERQLALLAGPTGVIVGLLLTGFALRLNPAVHVKNHVSPSLILLEGGARLLLSGLVVAAAFSRRRSLVGFSLLFLGTAMGSPLFALPFWGLGGYLIWRVFKYQKILNARGGSVGRNTGRAAGRPTGRGAGGGRVPANPRAAARAGSTAGRNRAQAARQRGRKQPEPAGPTPSKRYTPPKPTRPRPPAPPT